MLNSLVLIRIHYLRISGFLFCPSLFYHEVVTASLETKENQKKLSTNLMLLRKEICFAPKN